MIRIQRGRGWERWECHTTRVSRWWRLAVFTPVTVDTYAQYYSLCSSFSFCHLGNLPLTNYNFISELPYCWDFSPVLWEQEAWWMSRRMSEDVTFRHLFSHLNLINSSYSQKSKGVRHQNTIWLHFSATSISSASIHVPTHESGVIWRCTPSYFKLGCFYR